MPAAYGTGRTVTTFYDALNRPQTVAEGGRTTTYGYDLAGRALVQVLGNGQATVNGYDELGRLKERTLYESSAGLAPSGMLAKFEWSHDLAGNVTAQSEIWPGSVARGTGTTARTTAMTYDGANRLKTETVSDPVTGVTGTAYGYDAANNRQTKSVSGGSDPGYWDYAYNAANQLTGWTKKTSATGALLKTGTRTYDLNGNCESSTVVTGVVSETQTYTWNSQGRLTGVEMPGGQTHAYGYDYRARRVHLAQSGGTTPGSTTAVVFGGGLSLAEYESEEPEPITANAPTVHYTRGPDMGGGVGGLLYSERGSAVNYNLNNGRGDIVAQSDAGAALMWTASYEAYGKRPLETGVNADKQRANSKDEDPTGLLNEGFRYRDLETGVWLSRDPAGFVDGPNLYAYVKQNPWTSFDPDGLAEELIGHVYKLRDPEVKKTYIGSTSTLEGRFTPKAHAHYEMFLKPGVEITLYPVVADNIPINGERRRAINNALCAVEQGELEKVPMEERLNKRAVLTPEKRAAALRNFNVQALASTDVIAKEVTGPRGGQRRLAFDQIKGETLGPRRSVPASINTAAAAMTDAMAAAAMKIADDNPNWGAMAEQHAVDWANAVKTIYGSGAGGAFRMNDGRMTPLSDALAASLFNKPGFTGEGRVYRLNRGTGQIVQNHSINVQR